MISSGAPTCRLPERGRIGIFNRSYYEEVLVVRVHPELLRNQGLAPELLHEKTIWEERYRSIVDLERHLHRNGTRMVKIFLHLSQEEQRKRFLARIDEPARTGNSPSPTSRRGNTGRITQRPTSTAWHATSTDDAHWYVVPADDKPNARLIVSRIVLDALEDLKLTRSQDDPKRRAELLKIRKQLTKEPRSRTVKARRLKGLEVTN